MTDPDPTVRGQQLGDELRTLRETNALSLADAAERIDASASKLSRFETGRRTLPVEDIASLLAVYGVKGTRRRELLALAREAERRGWWQRNHPDFAQRQRTLIALEARAARVINFETTVVPGLLQTGEYTRALMTESQAVPPEAVEQHMITRLNRHKVLLRERPPKLHVLIHELALHQMVGGRDVLRRQLEHLLECSARHNISIRVVANTGGHVGASGAFTLLQQHEGPSVVFLENLTSSLFVEERHEVDVYRDALRNLAARALCEEQSGELIAEMARHLDTEASRE
ncbi:helix-turn-helix domain-containing protein [Saccharopolyspora erythraea]|nr:helix-turn-helix domain-containing protein [Saccharopolyspora erythraea]